MGLYHLIAHNRQPWSLIFTEKCTWHIIWVDLRKGVTWSRKSFLSYVDHKLPINRGTIINFEVVKTVMEDVWSLQNAYTYVWLTGSLVKSTYMYAWSYPFSQILSQLLLDEKPEIASWLNCSRGHGIKPAVCWCQYGRYACTVYIRIRVAVTLWVIVRLHDWCPSILIPFLSKCRMHFQPDSKVFTLSISHGTSVWWWRWFCHSSSKNTEKGSVYIS